MTIPETERVERAEPLLRASARALGAAAELLTRATDAVRALVTRDGTIERALLEREQHAVHGLAWLATYVEALRQLHGWAQRLDEIGRASCRERVWL
ncbi:MAG: acyl-CoA dehydrogenase, partial [Geminicoccaceae bacterium]|nr:acyl-CoA dehydrogenase [Geminicoccaceae bacterium]